MRSFRWRPATAGEQALKGTDAPKFNYFAIGLAQQPSPTAYNGTCWGVKRGDRIFAAGQAGRGKKL